MPGAELPPVCYNRVMEMVIRQCSSHAHADAADRQYYKSLSPQQRLDILLELVDTQRGNDESSQRLARVYQITKRHRS